MISHLLLALFIHFRAWSSLGTSICETFQHIQVKKKFVNRPTISGNPVNYHSVWLPSPLKAPVDSFQRPSSCSTPITCVAILHVSRISQKNEKLTQQGEAPCDRALTCAAALRKMEKWREFRITTFNIMGWVTLAPSPLLLWTV